jgi:lycopene cyclase domain-containing protein
MLSFDKKLQFYKQWPFVLPPIFIIGTVYILFDIYFTKLGVWGFNPLHHSNILLFKLPLEEWLFFIMVPYACIFLHESLVFYFPQIKLSNKTTRSITIGLIIVFALIGLFNLDKTYTIYISSLLFIALIFSVFDRSEVIRNLYFTFLIVLIPFVVVNAILTGSLIDEEIVWYNNSENLKIRFLTIPIEDFGYAFSLILLNLLLIARLKHWVHNK